MHIQFKLFASIAIAVIICGCSTCRITDVGEIVSPFNAANPAGYTCSQIVKAGRFYYIAQGSDSGLHARYKIINGNKWEPFNEEFPDGICSKEKDKYSFRFPYEDKQWKVVCKSCGEFGNWVWFISKKDGKQYLFSMNEEIRSIVKHKGSFVITGDCGMIIIDSPYNGLLCDINYLQYGPNLDTNAIYINESNHCIDVPFYEDNPPRSESEHYILSYLGKGCLYSVVLKDNTLILKREDKIIHTLPLKDCEKKIYYKNEDEPIIFLEGYHCDVFGYYKNGALLNIWGGRNGYIVDCDCSNMKVMHYMFDLEAPQVEGDKFDIINNFLIM